MSFMANLLSAYFEDDIEKIKKEARGKELIYAGNPIIQGKISNVQHQSGTLIFIVESPNRASPHTFYLDQQTRFVIPKGATLEERTEHLFLENCLLNLCQKKREAREIKEAIDELEEEREDNKAREKAVLKEIEFLKMNIPNFASFLKEDVERIKKHPKVKEFYFSKENNLIIVTEKLKINSPDYSSLNGKDSGTYVIKIDLRFGSAQERIFIDALTYEFIFKKYDEISPRNYSSPFIRDTYPCFGDNWQEVGEMFRRREIYLLVDFILGFLTDGFNDAANPYVSFSTWLVKRKKRGTTLFNSETLTTPEEARQNVFRMMTSAYFPAPEPSSSPTPPPPESEKKLDKKSPLQEEVFFRWK